MAGLTKCLNVAGWRDGKGGDAKDDSQAFDLGDLVPPHEIQQCSQTLGFREL